MKLNVDSVGMVTLVTSAITIVVVIVGCVTIMIYDNINHIPVPDFVTSTIQSFVLLAVGTLGWHIQSGSSSNGRQS